jgi:hypothetical protein
MGTEERPRDLCQRVMQQRGRVAPFFMISGIPDFAVPAKGFGVPRLNGVQNYSKSAPCKNLFMSWKGLSAPWAKVLAFEITKPEGSRRHILHG